MLEKRTSAEWEKIIGIKIIDFQGWKFGFGQLKPKVFYQKISQREFFRRSMYSLIKQKGEL